MSAKTISALRIMFVIFLVVGILGLILSTQVRGDASWGWIILALYSLLLAVILLPLLIVFRKRTREGAESVHDEGTENTNKHMEKTSIGLRANIAGLLCYLLGWISGIILIRIERDNKFVRFHAMQSIIVFGILNIAAIIFSSFSPFFGRAVLGVTFVLWVILMLEASQGKKYKLPWAGNLAEKHT